jgi:hypothetical protein
MTRFPQTYSAVLAVIAALVSGATGASHLSATVQSIIVALIVVAAGVLVPAVHLADPQTGRPLTRDSQLSSVVLSVAGAALAWLLQHLQLSPALDGVMSALLAALAAILAPSALARPAGRTPPPA